jgi:hypothetical protein
MKNRTFNTAFSGSKPAPMAIPKPNCPILLEARELLEKTKDLQRAIHKIKRSTQRCLTCPERSECPTMTYLARAVDTAIRELRAEWGLDAEGNE